MGGLPIENQEGCYTSVTGSQQDCDLEAIESHGFFAR
jgi:hypothetical protein